MHCLAPCRLYAMGYEPVLHFRGKTPVGLYCVEVCSVISLLCNNLWPSIGLSLIFSIHAVVRSNMDILYAACVCASNVGCRKTRFESFRFLPTAANWNTYEFPIFGCWRHKMDLRIGLYRPISYRLYWPIGSLQRSSFFLACHFHSEVVKQWIYWGFHIISIYCFAGFQAKST
jgi:hypothetical protein